MKNKQKIEFRTTFDFVQVTPARKEYHKIPIMKNFMFDKLTQDWNPEFPHKLDTKLTTRYFVPKHLQIFCEYLKDLFCIDCNILLDVRYEKNKNCGTCYSEESDDGYRKIVVGAKGGLRATTLVHEFLHMAGFDHEWQINDFADYRSTCTKDTYSPLIVKDIFGRKEVFLI